MFIGITYSENEREGRLVSNMLIQLLENIPQFIIVIREIFLYRNSISFLQAGNPIFALCMAYKLLGPFIGEGLYKALRKGDINPGILALISCFLLMMPQVYVRKMFDARMLKRDEIPDVLFDQGLLVDEDRSTFMWFICTLFAISAVIIISRGYFE